MMMVIMPSVIILSVVTLNVVAPLEQSPDVNVLFVRKGILIARLTRTQGRHITKLFAAAIS